MGLMELADHFDVVAGLHHFVMGILGTLGPGQSSRLIYPAVSSVIPDG